jgi:hypothetical protein
MILFYMARADEALSPSAKHLQRSPHVFRRLSAIGTEGALTFLENAPISPAVKEK